MDKLSLKPEQRLIVAADPKISELGIIGVKNYVIELAKNLSGTGVVIKINSALACGYSLIHYLHGLGFKVFVDGKYFDIPNTMTNYGLLLADAKPEIVTVSCGAGITAMAALKAELPEALVLGVTLLTSFDQENAKALYGSSVDEVVMTMADMAVASKIDGLICSPHEVSMLRKRFGDSLILCTPGIRPEGTKLHNDDQQRFQTPAQAILNGADYIVVGRPITAVNDPLKAAIQILEEIDQALNKD